MDRQETESLPIIEKNDMEIREEYTAAIREMKPRYENLTKEDKAKIREIAKYLEVKMGYCSRCYQDAYLEIRNKLGIVETVKGRMATGGWKFIGQQGLDWIGPFGKVRLSEMTPLRQIEVYVAQNPKQKDFIRVENNPTL